MVVHNFAMEHERNINFELDSFFKEGLQLMAQERADSEFAADADA